MSQERSIEELDELERKANKLKTNNFQSILENISELDPKKRVLWKEIYENAIQDRSHAYMMFSVLVSICEKNTTEHAVHGRSISSYIEKMQKANEQITRLAALIQKAEEEAEIIDPEEMFNKIQDNQR